MFWTGDNWACTCCRGARSLSAADSADPAPGPAPFPSVSASSSVTRASMPAAVWTDSQLQGHEFSLVKADFLTKVFGSLLPNLPLVAPAHYSSFLSVSGSLSCYSFSVSSAAPSLRGSGAWGAVACAPGEPPHSPPRAGPLLGRHHDRQGPAAAGWRTEAVL